MGKANGVRAILVGGPDDGKRFVTSRPLMTMATIHIQMGVPIRADHYEPTGLKTRKGAVIYLHWFDDGTRDRDPLPENWSAIGWVLPTGDYPLWGV